MKYNVNSLTSSQYLDLVNREEDPSQSKLEIKYARMGDTYFAYANTTVGKFVSVQLHAALITDEDLEKFFDEQTDLITKTYEAKKSSQITPGSFVVDPSRSLS